MTLKQKALALLAERGLTCEVERVDPFWGGGLSIEVLPPDGYLFDDGHEGLTGLVCHDWQDVIERVVGGEAMLIPEEVTR